MQSETDASLASSGNCRNWATGLGGRQAAHSRPSDRRRRTPDGRACCDDVVVRQDGGGRKIEVADDRQRPMRGGSSPWGTGEPRPGDTGELSLRAHGGPAAEHRASAARSGADVSSPGRTSQYHRRHGLRHPANAATCQWWFPATRPTTALQPSIRDAMKARTSSVYERQRTRYWLTIAIFFISLSTYQPLEKTVAAFSRCFRHNRDRSLTSRVVLIDSAKSSMFTHSSSASQTDRRTDRQTEMRFQQRTVLRNAC